MNRNLVRRISSLALLLTAVMATTAQAQQPTVVMSIRGIDPLLDDADFVGKEVGKPGMKGLAEQAINNLTRGKGLAGIDRKKPLGMFWNATAGGAPEMPVAFVPVSDAKALKELLKQFAPDLEDTNGEWSATVGIFKVTGKISGGYLFVSPNLPAKLPEPSKITNAKYDIAFDVSIASIPQEYKELFLTQLEEKVREGQEKSRANDDEAGAKGYEIGSNAAFEGFKTLTNDADRLTLGVDLDQKTRIGGIDMVLTAKSNTGLARILAAYGKTQPAFAGLGSDSALLRLVISHPSPFSAAELDQFSEFATSALDGMIDKDEKIQSEQDKATIKGLAKRFVGLLTSTAKTGSLHAGLVLESGASNKMRLLGGVKVSNGDEAGKLFDEGLKLVKSPGDLAHVKLDAAKQAGARIHAVTIDSDNPAVKHFGTDPAHLAFRADSVWMSLGSDNLNALKKALDSKPSPRVTTSPISVKIKPVALLMLLNGEDEDLAERGKKVIGKPGDQVNIDVAPVSNGAKLRVEFGLDLLQLANQGE